MTPRLISLEQYCFTLVAVVVTAHCSLSNSSCLSKERQTEDSDRRQKANVVFNLVLEVNGKKKKMGRLDLAVSY